MGNAQYVEPASALADSRRTGGENGGRGTPSRGRSATRDAVSRRRGPPVIAYRFQSWAVARSGACSSSVCRGRSVGNNSCDYVEGGVSAGNPVRAVAVRDRLIPVAAVGIVSIAAAESIAGMNARVPKPLVAVLALAGTAILLSVDAVQLFLGWLFVAPILQESASNSHVGHALGLALYAGPPLVLLVKHLAAQDDRPRAEWFDFFPALYFVYLVVSLGAT